MLFCIAFLAYMCYYTIHVDNLLGALMTYMYSELECGTCWWWRLANIRKASSVF